MKTESNYLIFEELENSNLKISLTDSGKEELNYMLNEQRCPNQHIWFTLTEQTSCNGSYAFVTPEDTGDLTDSPIILIEKDIDEDGDVVIHEDTKKWWFPDYMVIDELQELFLTGSVIFIKA